MPDQSKREDAREHYCGALRRGTMKKGRAFKTVFAVLLGCMLLLIGYGVIGAYSSDAEAGDSKKGVEKNERREYLKRLASTTSKRARENSDAGRHDDAIGFIGESIKKLEKSDHKNFPDVVGRIYASLSAAHFSLASEQMDQAIDWQRKCVELYGNSNDQYFYSQQTSQLAGLHFLQGDLKIAEAIHKKAIDLAEGISPEKKGLDRNGAVFDTKVNLMMFYGFAGRDTEATELAKELEEMIDKKQITSYDKEYIRGMLDAANTEGCT
jgi:tetratricopeptide (TPR) repeat protein